MAGDTKSKLSEMREWLNFLVTLIGAVGIGYLTLYSKNQRNEQRIESDARYETIEAHNADKVALSAVDGRLADASSKLSENQAALERLVQSTKAATDLKIQHLTDVINTRQTFAGKNKPNETTE